MRLNKIFQLKTIAISISCVAIPALIFYSLSVFLLINSGFSIVEILRDPAQQTGLSSLLGFVSNIGVWLWVSSATVCFFSLVSSRFSNPRGPLEIVLILGLLSLLLAVDDLFMLHDRHVHQKGIYWLYALCCLSLLLRHFWRIMEIDGFSFLFAGLLLAMSIYIDTHQRKIPMEYAHHQLIEEGLKFVGAAIWLFFCGKAALYYSHQVPRSQRV